ncbi:MAG: flagellar type III secretion system pore protein FliP [bacterium]|nr:flagellar type III secretion system pore protein FliP [bacterium]MCP5067388.1 flagellar type III secretion system pore protein FliP [bacterium]
MVETGSALLVVLGCLALLRVVLQWTGLAGTGGKPGGLHVVETCALGSRRRLHVVEVAGERLLVGSSESGLAMLHHLPESQAPEPEAKPETSALPNPIRRLIQGGASLGLLLITVFLSGDPAFAEGGLTISIDGLEDPEQLNSTLEMVAFFTLVGVAPSILLMATSFTRIVIVLAFLRQAIGVQHLPPNQVLVGLALFTTMFVMAPLGDQIRVDAYEPYVAKEIDASQAAELAIDPVRKFLLQSTQESDLNLFLEISGTDQVEDLADVPFTTLLPSYMLSELRTAFEIGFMIYLPFLVVDLVIASMLISMGMIVLPPIVISLPFKLMLFVLLDGWNLVLGSLISGLR